MLGLVPVIATGDSYDPGHHAMQEVLPDDLTLPNDGIWITNHVVMGIVAGLVVLGVFYWLSRRMQPSGDAPDDYLPGGPLAQLLETICEFVREQVARPCLKHATDRYVYYIWTVFFFILFCNLLGLVPFGRIFQLVAVLAGLEQPVDYWSHWGGTATANLSLNAPLALCSFIAVIYIGIRESGTGFFKHFVPVPFQRPRLTSPGAFFGPLAMNVVAAMVSTFEVVSLVIRCVVLAMRLFGTMFAGHMALGVIVGLTFVYAGTAAWLGYGVGIVAVLTATAMSALELFVAVLQAFIFTFLTVMFIAEGAIHEEEHAAE